VDFNAHRIYEHNLFVRNFTDINLDGILRKKILRKDEELNQNFTEERSDKFGGSCDRINFEQKEM
jgi:hypothetical protein